MDIQEEHGLMEADMTRETHMENEAENKEPALLEERLHSRLSTVRPLNQETMDLAWKRWDNIGKPLRSLGLLEKNLVKIAGIQETARPSIKKRALIAMCADNGVVAEGVTQTGWEVTAAVAQNMAADASSVAVMSDVAGVKVFPVDIGGRASDRCSRRGGTGALPYAAFQKDPPSHQKFCQGACHDKGGDAPGDPGWYGAGRKFETPGI